MKAKDARPIVKKYIAHDFLSELENDDRKCAEHSGQEKVTQCSHRPRVMADESFVNGPK